MRLAPSSARLRQTAEEAWQVEAVDARLAGGRQDQYAAALGGFNHFRFTAHGVASADRARSRVQASLLADSIIICYTGASRVSSRMISRVMDGYAAKDPQITGALRGSRITRRSRWPRHFATRISRGRATADGELGFQMALDPGDADRRDGATGGCDGSCGVAGRQSSGCGCRRMHVLSSARDADAAREAGRPRGGSGGDPLSLGRRRSAVVARIAGRHVDR